MRRLTDKCRLRSTQHVLAVLGATLLAFSLSVGAVSARPSRHERPSQLYRPPQIERPKAVERPGTIDRPADQTAARVPVQSEAQDPVEPAVARAAASVCVRRMSYRITSPRARGSDKKATVARTFVVCSKRKSAKPKKKLKG